jgi:hypothetical protein
MWSNLAFSVFLLAMAGGMCLMQLIARRGWATEEMDDRARKFHQAQHRRRLLVAAVTASIGVGVMGAIWVQGEIATVIYWSCVLMLVLWIGLLAIRDFQSSWKYYGQLRKEQMEEHAELTSELARIRRRDSNGRARRKPPT